jgi:hypothetical protein
MANYGRQSAAAQRQQERRLREDEAPRLAARVPNLRSLSLAITERSDASVSQPKYVRRIIVERAPALFLIGCSDPKCEEGGHDVTATVMRALLDGETAFQGEDKCYGALGSAQCTRILRYDATALYSDEPPEYPR